jgi:hypothetical protein
MFFAVAAKSATAASVVYCNDQPRTDTDVNCTYPPGSGTRDPCQADFQSWGGWYENYYDTYQQGKYPYGEGYVITYNGSCSLREDECIFKNPELHHMNDGACAANFSWDAGLDVGLAVKNYGSPYTWYICVRVTTRDLFGRRGFRGRMPSASARRHQ